MEYEKLKEAIRMIVREELAAVNLAEPEFLTVSEAADLTKFAQKSLRNMVYEKRVPFIKKGKKLLFHKPALIKWLRADRERTCAPRRADHMPSNIRI